MGPAKAGADRDRSSLGWDQPKRKGPWTLESREATDETLGPKRAAFWGAHAGGACVHA